MNSEQIWLHIISAIFKLAKTMPLHVRNETFSFCDMQRCFQIQINIFSNSLCIDSIVYQCKHYCWCIPVTKSYPICCAFWPSFKLNFRDEMLLLLYTDSFRSISSYLLSLSHSSCCTLQFSFCLNFWQFQRCDVTTIHRFVLTISPFWGSFLYLHPLFM